MNKLTIEQKARRYDEAIEKAKDFYKGYKQRDNQLYADDLESIFPELKSEDERIRKGIIRNLEYLMDRAEGFVKDELKERIAWLEKIGKNTTNKGESNLLTHERAMEISPFMRSGFENKVEPKFKIEEGKWYVCTQTYVLRGKIVVIKGQTYQVEKDNVIKGEDGCLFIDRHDGKASDYFRYWTIQDAKDGDVLCYKDEISLYRHDIKNCTKQETTFGGFVYYCCYDGKRFVVDSLYSLTEQDKMDIHPATKEQRDLLFQKMKEAGYEWDSENRKLKKIDHKELTDFQEGLRGILIESNGKYDDNTVIRLSGQVLGLVEQKPWSEEDEKVINLACSILYSNFNENENFDKNQMCIGEIIDKLKSLKNRYTWKPSKEQIKALDIAIRCGIQLGSSEEIALRSLLKQLEDLKGLKEGKL